MNDQPPGETLDHSKRWLFEPMTGEDTYAHAITRVLADQQTEHQHMRIVESATYGTALLLDGQWQSSTGDEFIYHEAMVHAAACAHGAPRSVLILGGAEGATAREALKWPTVERIVTCDIDRQVIDACRQHMPEMAGGAFEDPRHELVVGDAFGFIDRAADGNDRFDLIISDLSDPIEDGPSWRLFTRETFAQCKRALTAEGIFIIQAGGIAPAEVGLHARVSITLASVFTNVSSLQVPVPIFGTPLGMLIASDSPIDRLPDVDATDTILEPITDRRFIDGRTLLGLYQVPLYVRKALAQEGRVFTLDDPPRFGSD
ncbi:MAG: spermidine synthase [Planctomycetota bacterium]